MRIISGKARGTKLYTLDGLETRPTLDRVKESLFNIIQNKIEDSTVLDLFAGSGAIGLEFVSRGASKAFLVDSSKDALKIIEKNVEKIHCNEKVQILNMNFKKALERLENIKFDFIYLDPPYKTEFIKESLQIILKIKCINKDSIIILETDEKERIKKEIEHLEEFKIIDERKYGRANLIFLTIE